MLKRLPHAVGNRWRPSYISVLRQIASRELTPGWRCHACRSFSATVASSSGHSKWATIKHDKAKNDSVKNKQRSVFAQELQQASSIGGPNPAENPRLALIINNAKKAGFAKSSIEAAIARGQGLSPTGSALEPLTIEAILPPSIGTIIECLTESKGRTLQDVRHVVRQFRGSPSPAAFMFVKTGQIVCRRVEGQPESTTDDIFMQAADLGALDMEEDSEGNVVVYTPADTVAAVREGLEVGCSLKVVQSSIGWQSDEGQIGETLDAAAAAHLCEFADAMRSIAGVQEIYMNVGGVAADLYEDLKSKVQIGNNARSEAQGAT